MIRRMTQRLQKKSCIKDTPFPICDNLFKATYTGDSHPEVFYRIATLKYSVKVENMSQYCCFPMNFMIFFRRTVLWHVESFRYLSSGIF